jgi:glycerol-3-phosphate dehydrogenase
MAEQVVDRAIAIGGLAAVPCPTRTLPLHGNPGGPGDDPYGTDAPLLAGLPGHDRLLHPDLPYTEAMVRFAIHYEQARTIEDILARRTRALFHDAAAAEACIERIARIVLDELNPSPEQLVAMIDAAHDSAARFSLKI